jgi:phosphoserine phosphatase RsbU/P
VHGLFEKWSCSIKEQRLFPGDILALYSDGITEASNAAAEEFGAQRLAEALRRNREVNPKAVLTSIVDAARHFSASERQDDMTVAVAKCRENSKRI